VLGQLGEHPRGVRLGGLQVAGGKVLVARGGQQQRQVGERAVAAGHSLGDERLLAQHLQQEGMCVCVCVWGVHVCVKQ
jgi:hypothetical protein